MVRRIALAAFVILGMLAAAIGCQSTGSPPPAAPKTTEKKQAEPQKSQAAPEKKQAETKPAATAPAKSAAEPAKPKQLTKLGIAYSVLSGDPTAFFLAKEAGIFEKNGIDAELIYIGGSTKIAQAILGGDVKIGQAAVPAAVSGALGGADFVMIGSMVNVFTFSMFSPKDITAVAQLKGKIVAATAPNTATDFAARFALKKNGVDPKDVTLIYTNGTPETLAALKSGGVQAGVVPPPQTLLARAAGLRELVDISQIGVAFGQAPILTTRSFVKQNPQLIRAFIKSVTESIALAKKDKQQAKAAIGKYVKSTDDAILEETYQVYVAKAYPKAPYITPDAVKTALEVLDDPKAKASKPEDFIDNSFVKELDDNGFIAGLYK